MIEIDAPEQDGESSISSAQPARAFTPAEYEVAQLLMEGLSNSEIADLLQIAPDTLKKHVGQVFHKCGRHSRVGAVVFLHENRHLLGIRCLSCDV